MELFTPQIGLLFWMLIAFLIVFFILSKYAWPAIIKGVDERGKFIDDSIKSAKQANEQLENIRMEGEKIMAEAREKQLSLIQEATSMRNDLIKEAKQQAEGEAAKIKQTALLEIQREKEVAMREIREQVAQLSVDIAEKILRKNLENKQAQTELINKLLEEVKN